MSQVTTHETSQNTGNSTVTLFPGCWLRPFEIGRIHDHAVELRCKNLFTEELLTVQAVRRCENEVFAVQNVFESMTGSGENTLAVIQVLLEEGN